MFDRVLNTSYSVYWECYIFQTNQPKWNMALLWRLYRSRLTQQKKFGLQSLDFLCLLMQKQKSGSKLANCDLQINFVFWQITLSIFLWNLWIKAFLLWEFSEKLLFTLQALQLLISQKNITLYIIFFDLDFFVPKPQLRSLQCSPAPPICCNCRLNCCRSLLKSFMVFTMPVHIWYQRSFCFPI